MPALLIRHLSERYQFDTAPVVNRLGVFQTVAAVHISSKRAVMIHWLNSTESNLPACLAAQMQIDHPQLPEVFDTGTIEADGVGICYLILRHPGRAEPLRHYMTTHQITSEQMTLWFRELITLMQFLHDAGWAGIDLQPEYITMLPTGQLRLLTVGAPLAPETTAGIAGFCKPDGATERTSEFHFVSRSTAITTDLCGLARTLCALLKSAPNLSPADQVYLTKIAMEIEQAGHRSDNEKTPDLAAYLDRLNLSHHLTLQVPELNPFPASTLRIPEMVGVSLTPRLRRLLGHPWFQRLQRVKQLGLAYLVYPGAQHTRFEHSLGVYHNVTAYISALLANPDNATFRLMMTEGDILTAMLAGLLHDIGHYPFAHAMEDVDHQRFSHIRRTYWFLSADMTEALKHIIPCEKSLSEMIAEDWPVEPENIVRILGKPDRTPMDANKVRIFQSIISSPIDADKLDYLTRDSIHTGVQYGRSIDRDRFLQALTINNGGDSIALSEKGRISAEMFMICRYAMYSEVYWHHAIRALHAMIKGAFRFYFAEQGEAGKTAGELTPLDQLLLTASDDGVIELLEQSGGKAGSLVGCLRRRHIYKRALVVRSSDEDRDLFEHLIQVEKGGQHNLERFRTLLREHLAGLRDFAGLKDEDLLLDIPPGQSIKSIQLILSPSGREIHLGDQSNVWENIRLNFEKWVRKIRFYVHPDFYERFQQADRVALGREIKDCAAQFYYRD